MKWTIALLLGVVLVIPKSWGQDPKAPTDLSVYLEQLQLKLDHAAQRANQPSTGGSSVVGLRGSQQDSGSKQLYWKGKAGAAPVSTEEVKDFRAAIELAGAGEKTASTTALKTFLEKYPKSAFKYDAEESLKKLSLAAAAPAKP